MDLLLQVLGPVKLAVIGAVILAGTIVTLLACAPTEWVHRASERFRSRHTAKR